MSTIAAVTGLRGILREQWSGSAEERLAGEQFEVAPQHDVWGQFCDVIWLDAVDQKLCERFKRYFPCVNGL